ncbi:Hypothetical predicted protein [Pelobates cultripes]|uniref:Uncharacterized protein n=1 Tax=Pelobates cultripes TaxID=61616 RepID=A0AAD1S273_PELCU|nr:Hypothetical predicted protein [Pelobates cultripes]
MGRRKRNLKREGNPEKSKNLSYLCTFVHIDDTIRSCVHAHERMNKQHEPPITWCMHPLPNWDPYVHAYSENQAYETPLSHKSCINEQKREGKNKKREKEKMNEDQEEKRKIKMKINKNKINNK